MVPRFNYSQADINTRVSNISNYDNVIEAIGRQLGVEIALIKAVIAVESSGNPRAGEGRVTGAKGLMQIIDQTWRSTIENFPDVNYKGTSISNYKERDINNAWADTGLNVLVGTLTLILKARS
jgi:peptidoglycan L-alanyl-D-glutamate endopeptidase CwlK